MWVSAVIESKRASDIREFIPVQTEVGILTMFLLSDFTPVPSAKFIAVLRSVTDQKPDCVIAESLCLWRGVQCGRANKQSVT